MLAGTLEFMPVPIDGTLVELKTNLQLFHCGWIEEAIKWRHNEFCVSEEAEIGYDECYWFTCVCSCYGVCGDF